MTEILNFFRDNLAVCIGVICAGAALFLILVILIRKNQKERMQEMEMIREKRRDEMLTQALINPEAGYRGTGPAVPVDVAYSNQSARTGNFSGPAVMAELTEIGAVSRKKYLFNLGTAVSLGAGADCSLCLNYRGVAGHHCELFLHGTDACARSLPGCRTVLQRGGHTSEIAPGGVFVKNGDRLMLGEAILEIRLLKA